jgi:hypothetical protein
MRSSLSLLFTVFVASAAFHAPSSSALRALPSVALRVPTNANPTPRTTVLTASIGVTTATATFLAGTGALAWVAPKANADLYGITSDVGIGDTAYYQIRQIGAWQLVQAAVLCSGLHGVRVAAATLLIANALAIFACIPVQENQTPNRPKAPSAITALAFAALGKLTLAGAVRPMLSAALVSALGLLIHLTPRETASMYEVSPEQISTLYLSMLGVLGSTILYSGAYVAGLALGLTQARAFGYTLLLQVLFALKWALTEASGVGAKTAATVGPLAWRTAAQAALAFLALR